MKLIDMHCDTILECMINKCGIKENNLCIDIEKLKKANSMAQFFALYVRLTSCANPMDYCLEMVDRFYTEIEKNSDSISFAKSYKELMDNYKNGKKSAFLAIEEGGAINGELYNLRNFYRLGVRLITLTWNYPNQIGYPNYGFEYSERGLTEFGRKVVAEMNRLGMIIDISHASDQVFYDVAELSDKPFVASHSNARALTCHARNMTDDMIKLLAKKGGIMGLNFESAFLGESEIGMVSDIVRHARHIYNVGGIDVLAIGSDFDGTTHQTELKNIGEINILYEALKKSGFSEAELEKIFYKNALRVIKEVL